MYRHPHAFQRELEALLGIKLDLRINDNRSTMLSIKCNPDATKVSLHRMFLEAPKNIMEALACYIGNKKNVMSPIMKAYIDDNLKKLDYSYQLDLSKLETRGAFFDLKKIYNNINEDYFDRKLNLAITWFGQPRIISSSKVTFGLYSDPLKLIKIHRLLDDKRFPDYFVSFVVYHEMLHYLCPSHVDKKGTRHIHSKKFREMEKQYHDYQRAQDWLKDNQKAIFGGIYHGRS